MELKKLAILGSTGFIGNRLYIDLKNKYKIIRIDRKLKFKKNLKIDYLICCSGPNKFWCERNKKSILKKSTYFAKKIQIFSERNSVKNIIYFSSIHVLKKNDKALIPYIKWHQNIEKYLKKLKINKKIIRLPNLFGKPIKNKKNFWDFFISSIIKKSFLKKKIIIKNKPNKKIFAMPLNFFINFLKKEINKDFIKLTRIINLSSYYKFRTDELLYIIKEILKKRDVAPKIALKNGFPKNLILNSIISNSEYSFFEKEIIDVSKFAKKSN